ncbi:sugar phosphate isomerase/epimerase family protein [Fimbriiglobus ruber]|uniref:sugar phosphate isomerase/epimerase family protein n=1 Tax=Fimbriiglobus ruber TaxID=1908690 RepID=UPI00117BB84D|nr:TIM barrel protein [Fimbriiglobus ruber]
MNRRAFLASAASSVALPSVRLTAAPSPAPTDFQIACMTLPYSRFPLDRALAGIKASGFRYVAWGTTHKDAGKDVPVLAPDAPPERAKELAVRCRDMGLEPLMMFSTVYPEHKDGLTILKQRLLQAGAARVPQVLTFGHTKGGNRKLWVERLTALGPIARDNNVLLVVKQHGGETGTGEACAAITREVNHPNVKVNYDAGNVLDYLDKDPIPDIKHCAAEVRSFCIKDHRNWPKDEDCGPGFGEIDHYKLLHPVAFTGQPMPLCCENIFAPLVPRPAKPEAVDVLAKRAREFLEVVVAGLQKVKE